MDKSVTFQVRHPNRGRFGRLRNWLALLVTCGLFSSLGCTGATAEATSAKASGVVNVDGKPLTGGNITLISADDSRWRATGRVRPDGTFRVTGAPIGTSWVMLDNGFVKSRQPSAYIPLPKKYTVLKETDLTISLEPGENVDVVIECNS